MAFTEVLMTKEISGAVCGKGFGKKWVLRRTQKMCKSVTKEYFWYLCKSCGKHYTSKRGVVQHCRFYKDVEEFIGDGIHTTDKRWEKEIVQ